MNKNNEIRVKRISPREMTKLTGVSDITGFALKKGERFDKLSGGKTGLIVLRNDAPKNTEFHEIYHAKARHTKPRNPRTFVRQEIDADKYAYENTGQPKHLERHCRGLFLGLRDDYDIPPLQRLTIMRQEIMPRKDIPKTWKDDFKAFEQEGKTHKKSMGEAWRLYRAGLSMKEAKRETKSLREAENKARNSAWKRLGITGTEMGRA